MPLSGLGRAFHTVDLMPDFTEAEGVMPLSGSGKTCAHTTDMALGHSCSTGQRALCPCQGQAEHSPTRYLILERATSFNWTSRVLARSWMP